MIGAVAKAMKKAVPKTGAVAQAVKKPAPQMAQKAPAKPMGLMKSLTAFANRSKAPAQKAPSQFVPKMPIVGSGKLQQGEAARNAFEAAQKARGVKSMPPPMGAGGVKGLGQMASQPRPGGFLSGAAGIPQNRTQSDIAAKYGALGGAGTGLLKAFGAKKGGAVPSKMGAVKTSAKRDGVATKGKTKATMVKMAKGGKAR